MKGINRNIVGAMCLLAFGCIAFAADKNHQNSLSVFGSTNTDSSLYAEDFDILTGKSASNGVIKVSFDTPVDTVSLLILNTSCEGDFILKANTGQKATVHLYDHSYGGDIGIIQIKGKNIKSVTITSTQPIGVKAFKIDNLNVKPRDESDAEDANLKVTL